MPDHLTTDLKDTLHKGQRSRLTETSPATGLLLYKGPWSKWQLIHLLKRTMFGAKKADIEYFKEKPLADVVNELLSPTAPLPPPPVNDYDEIGLNNIQPGKTWVNTPYTNEGDDDLRTFSFMKWSMMVFVEQDRSIREKMTLFLHNHFATQPMGRSTMTYLHHTMLRENALGNLKELTKLVTKDAHMLRFLNGEKNTRLAPNENYARELQELFCVGKALPAHYTEDDVKQAARVLTGWKVNYDTHTSNFDEKEHDTTDKTFSSFYHHSIIKGRSGPNAGEEELNDLVNMIFAHPETALFICRKIYRWFVYYEINEQTEKNLIAPLAEILRKNNYELKPVLSALFQSEHFYDSNISASQIKSPLDFCIGLQREFDVKYPPASNFVIRSSIIEHMTHLCGEMGQTYPSPPSVSGWPAYYQVPGFYELWINGSTLPKRNEFSSIMIDYGYNREGFVVGIDVISFAASFSDPGNPDTLISESLELLYRVPVSASSRMALKKNYLLSGQNSDHYWTIAWNDHRNNPSDEIKKGIVETRLKILYRFIVNSAEFQLC